MDSDQIKSQFAFLEVIKEFDEKLFRLTKELNQVPVDRAKLENDLSGKKETFTSHKVEFEKLEKEIRKLEQELKEKEDRIRKSEGKLMEVKTNEEYKAATVEVENQKKEKSAFEDKVIDLISKSDVDRSQLKEVENEFKAQEKICLEQLEQLKKDEEKIRTAINAATEERNKSSVQLDASIRKKYETIRTEMPVGVAYVEKGRCLGCRVSMRPHLFNQILSFREIATCPNCHRVLIPQKPAQDEKNNPIL